MIRIFPLYCQRFVFSFVLLSVLFSVHVCGFFFFFFKKRDYFLSFLSRIKYSMSVRPTYIYPHPLPLPIFGNLKTQRIERLLPSESTLKKAGYPKTATATRRRIPQDHEGCQHSERASQEHGSWPIEPVTGCGRKTPQHTRVTGGFIFTSFASFFSF